MLEWLGRVGRVGLVELTVRLFQEIVRKPDRPEREVTLN